MRTTGPSLLARAAAIIVCVAALLTLGGTEALAWTGRWMAAEPMGSARSYHTATRLLDGRVLVVGGSNGSTLLSSAEIYDPATGKWTPTGSMRAARYVHTATLLKDGKVLVAGGLPNLSFGVAALASAEIYDPATGQWAATGAMTQPRLQAKSVLVTRGPLAGKVLIAGGLYVQCCGFPLATTEIYDPVQGSWSKAANMLRRRYFDDSNVGGLQALPDGTVFLVGGNDADSSGYIALNEAEIYSPATQAWSEAAGKQTNAQGAAVALSHGRLLVAGGYVGRALASTADAEIFDPVTRKWTATASLAGPVSVGSLTKLRDGRVLSAGGRTGRFGLCLDRAGADFYAAARAKWITAASPSTPRNGHSATLLPDGSVLVAGGVNCSSSSFASAERYLPVDR